ncbi:MAG: hypothetical protein KDB00_12345 [Planctomycetales bacterium]|nr:hypothetical protein [Planctomycetales bacterium]
MPQANVRIAEVRQLARSVDDPSTELSTQIADQPQLVRGIEDSRRESESGTEYGLMMEAYATARSGASIDATQRRGLRLLDEAFEDLYW